MHQLRTLGALDLRAPDGTAVRSILAQPKRLALLIYLALARPRGFQRRDTIVAMFWPELDQEHARGALSRAVYWLRRALGAGALSSNGGDDLCVSDVHVDCDAAAFEVALDAGKFEEALAAYHGDLLEGFFISGAPAFERWLEDERKRLRERAAEAASRLATKADADGNLPLAVHWAGRSVALLPYDEEAFRRYARSLDRAGDRATAVRAFEDFARRLNDDLEVEPSSETQSLITEIRRRDGHTERSTQPLPAQLAAVRPSRAGGSTQRVGARRMFVLAAAIVVVAVGVAIRSIRAGFREDPNVVAVLPFRVIGDPSLAYLREGMVDLFAAKLNGDAGPRAAAVIEVMSAWRGVADANKGAEISLSDQIRIARKVRAGEVLTGSVVATARSLVLNAQLLAIPEGAVHAAATVQGPVDSLLPMIDRVTGQLLASGAGERSSELASLTSTSLPALRAYLAGKMAYRQGKYEEAVRHFTLAISLDSSFTLAAVALAGAANWIGDSAALAGGAAVMHAGHAQRKGLFIHPERPGQSSLRELEEGEPSGDLADDVEAWTRVADLRFHGGSTLGTPLRLTLDHAAAEFRRALEIDSAYGPALSHLLDYSVAVRDTAAAWRYGAQYLAVDSAGDLADYVRWVAATLSADGTALGELRSRFPRMKVWSLVRIVGEAELEGIGVDDAARAAAVIRGRVGSPGEVRNIYAALHGLALNGGQPTVGVATVVQWAELDHAHEGHDRRLILDALYWNGDREAAERAVGRLSPLAYGPPMQNPTVRAEQRSDLCAVELWRLAHGIVGSASAAIRELRYPAATVSTDPAIGGEVCATLLEALLASQTNRADRAATLDRLDSVLVVGPAWNGDIQYADVGNLILARLREERGDVARALAAIRRRSYEWWMPTFLSSYLREEGRLAALTGDRVGAIRAYQHYLALRPEPAPMIAAEVRQVRAELAKLIGGSGQ